MASEQYTKKMLDGWYCRSIANMQASEAAASASSSAPPPPAEPQRAREARKDYSSDSSSEPEPEPNYRAQYLALKKKLKYLIYENECFQDALRNSQKRMLKISRDRSFLLDRLLQYEKGESSTSESEDTDSSDDTDYQRVDDVKRKKLEGGASNQNMTNPSMNKGPAVKRKRTVMPKKQANVNHAGNERILACICSNKHSNVTCQLKKTLNDIPKRRHLAQIEMSLRMVHRRTQHQASAAMLGKAAPGLGSGVSASDGHMTPEEVERHLQSRHSYLELLPERAPPTVPTEMFSNDPSLDSESNDVLENSPNVEEWFD